jgi:hypothetical protein
MRRWSWREREEGEAGSGDSEGAGWAIEELGRRDRAEEGETKEGSAFCRGKLQRSEKRE